MTQVENRKLERRGVHLKNAKLLQVFPGLGRGVEEKCVLEVRFQPVFRADRSFED